MRRVVVTGIGAITPLGIGKDALWAGILSGRSAVRRLSRFDTSALNSKIAASVENFDARDYVEAKTARRLDRFSQFSVAGARMALDDAGLAIDRQDGRQAGAYIGSALGGVANAEEEHVEFIKDGIRAVNRLIALSVFNGAGACNVSIAFGLKGPSLSNANSCASGTIAVGDALAFVLSRLRNFSREDFARFHPAGSLGRKLVKVEAVMRRGPDLRRADHALPAGHTRGGPGRAAQRCGDRLPALRP